MKKTKKIILIDDNKIDLFVNQKIIEIFDPSIQLKTFTKASAAICYLKILEFNKDFKSLFIPDIIFLDINMPEMDGFQFLAELKQLEIIKKHQIDIFMLSSSSSLEDINKAKSHQFCKNYYNKPLTNKTLQEIFQPERGYAISLY
ncbi:response regulator [Geojedonia litorea]|uniref:Response regulator n=1 Tax=Geojedonia litorea TaxID=1268269 RepID=A0ABV9N5W9_9FLAO